MSNSFFHFKQFTIYQDRCAMKVCTDACLFGGWMVDLLYRHDLKIKNALDIGTGTSLLSLMLAQENDVQIDSLEINDDAASQATENASASPWKDKITVINQSLQEFATDKKYDFIFSNPPFFENDLVSDDKNKNTAKHDSSLTLDVLVDFMSKHLGASGYASVLLPYHRVAYFKSLLQKNSFAIMEEMNVRQSVSHGYFRTMIFFSDTTSKSPEVKEMSIHDEGRNYTVEFAEKLRNYYLKL